MTKEYKKQVDPHLKDKEGVREVVCYKCLHGGTLLCCCGRGCRRMCHPSCVDPPLSYIPPGFWHCIWCVKKKIKLGVHSVSEGVESILDSREVASANKVMRKEYFVKYHGLAHAHNRWIPETQLHLEAPKLLAKFKRKLQVIRWKRDWSTPHRLLLKREIALSKQNDQRFNRHDEQKSICRYEWLVKWTGLGYDHVSWELDDATFMTSSEGMKLIHDYESRRKRADRLSKNNFEDNEECKASFVGLSVLPVGDSPELYNQHSSYVNKLRMCWHKGQSALIVDDQSEQERVMKGILFVLSLNCNVKRPFLIISTSAALSVWETEFLRLAPSANLVVYKGNKDLRRSIRALEFSNEDDGVLFQILLSSLDIVVEDLSALSLPWEAIIIDECQQSRILGHLDNIKILAAEMRLLLLGGPIKEDQSDYIKLLSFLKSGRDGLKIAQTETYLSTNISNLKIQLEQYVAFKCNSGSNKFVEYWVPAPLSSLQLEQYCSILLSNSMLLCSGRRSDSVDALHDLIISTKKCCNHPYLLDLSLHNIVTRDLPVDEHLNVEIKASGKLQLVEKILLDARNRGLRVIILFQSTSGSGSIGDILDDVLCRRFGEDCYVRYGKDYTPSTMQAALDAFNDKESGKFVFLMENRACQRSIKLSLVDTVILFDSHWDPQIDLRGLRRMCISSQFKQLTVFRLYSYFTIEEKFLTLAKEGITLDTNLQLINHNTCHTLLKWGASYLLNKLDDLHGSDIDTTVSAPHISDPSLLSDVFCELSSQLVCDGGDTDGHGLSFISRVQQNEGEYARNILLLGERVMKKLSNESHAFSWSDLLERRHPRWKFLPASSQRIRKTVENFDYLPKKSECENDTFIRKRRTACRDSVDPKRRKVTKDNFDLKKRKVSKDIDCSKYLKTRLKKKNSSVVNLASKLNGNKNGFPKVVEPIVPPLANAITIEAAINKHFSEHKKLFDRPKSRIFLPKSDVSSLCDMLHYTENVKVVAMRILKHILKHYNVDCQEVSTMQSFRISVCWLAAALMNHKIDRKDSLALAKLHLNFKCEEEETLDVYSELWKYKKDFLNCLQNGHSFDNCNINGASDSEIPELRDLAEEDQMGFVGPDVVKSATDEHDFQRKSHTAVRSTEIWQSDCNIYEDVKSSVNEIVANDNAMNISTHSLQPNSVEMDTSTVIPEVGQCNSVMSPVCGDSNNLDFVANTYQYMQSSNVNQCPLPQDNSDSTVMPLNNFFNHSGGDHCDIQEAELILQASNGPVEPVNSSIISPVTPQLSTSVPVNVNTTVPHSITSPGSINDDLFQAPSIVEMPNVAHSDPLLVEMDIIKKETEEAHKIRERKIMELKSDFKKEAERLDEKYSMLLQNVNTAATLEKKELERQRETVLMSKVLSEVWMKKLDSSKGDARQCTKQVAMPSCSSRYMPTQSFEQFTELPSVVHPSLSTPMGMFNSSYPEITQFEHALIP